MKALYYAAAVTAFALGGCAGTSQQASNPQANQLASNGSAMSPHSAATAPLVGADETISQGSGVWTNTGALTSPNSMPSGYLEHQEPAAQATYSQGQPIWIGGGERETANELPSGFADEPPPSPMGVTFGQHSSSAPNRVQSAQAPNNNLPAQN